MCYLVEDKTDSDSHCAGAARDNIQRGGRLVEIVQEVPDCLVDMGQHLLASPGGSWPKEGIPAEAGLQRLPQFAAAVGPAVLFVPPGPIAVIDYGCSGGPAAEGGGAESGVRRRIRPHALGLGGWLLGAFAQHAQHVQRVGERGHRCLRERVPCDRRGPASQKRVDPEGGGRRLAPRRGGDRQRAHEVASEVPEAGDGCGQASGERARSSMGGGRVQVREHGADLG